MIRVEVVGSEEVRANLELASHTVHKRVVEAVSRVGVMLTRRVKEKLNGEVLKVGKTGNLRRSIHAEFTDDSSGVTGTVGTNVPYGRMWELGFDRKVGAFARGGGAGMTAAQRAAYAASHPPGVKHEAPRSFLGSTIDEMRPNINQLLTEAVRKGFGT